MPYVIVKLWPRKSEQQKARLAEAIAKDVMDVFGYGEESVSVAMEEVEARDWAEKVYKPDIVNTPNQLYKKPGYKMSELPWREDQRRGGKPCEEQFCTARATFASKIVNRRELKSRRTP